MIKPFRVKILLVDDKENNLISMASIFSDDNYDIETASSGKEALKILLKEWNFALILMDVEMPELNGFETATLIYEREKLRHIPIIFVTAHNQGDENLYKGYQTGAVDYIYKPVMPQLLRAKVHVFVELYKKNHQLIKQEQKLITANKNLEMEIKDRIASEEKVIELNKQLLEYINRLEVINKELDGFAYMASHDLQEPLRKIKLFSERIMSKFENDLDSESKGYVSKIQKACTRMQTLINDIFTLSKISNTEHTRAQTDMNILMKEVLSDMESEIREKNAEIVIDNLPSLYVNQSLIKRLFLNLIENAIKYSQKDLKPVIRISSKLDAQGPQGSQSKLVMNKYCRIYVEDNGIGFDQQYAEQVFVMFRRLHLASQYEGTGIGLAICKKIVDEHQGFISAKSAVNEGTTFTISLPMEVSLGQN